MGCKQSTLRANETPAVAAVAPATTPAPTVAVAAPAPAVQSPAVQTPAVQTPEVQTLSPVVVVASPAKEHSSAASSEVDDLLAEVFAAGEKTEIVASPRVESMKAASPARLGERATSVLNVEQQSAVKTEEPAVSFSEFLAQQENTTATAAKTATKPRKVLFDAETMRKSAPKSAAPHTTKLTKKQQDLVKKNHVSVGRRGPVASRFEKGSRSQMQSEMYLQMANAFERLLTNAETINAHLDTR